MGVALYRAGRLHAKYVLHVPDPPLDYCFALEEVRFLETLQTIENQQQSGRPISNEKRQQFLQIWECDLLPIKENENDNHTLNLTKQSLKNNRTKPKKNYETNADSSTKNLKNDRTRTKKNYRTNADDLKKDRTNYPRNVFFVRTYSTNTTKTEKGNRGRK